MPISSSSSSFGSDATSYALLPCTSSVSIDVAAWQIAQPRPENFTSSIVSPSSPNETKIETSSPQSGFWPSALRVGVLDQPVAARILVVVEDHLAV